MAGTEENETELEVTEDESSEDGSEEAAPEGEASTGASDDDKSSKRIRDLQSRADANEARANKAEQALAAALGKGSGTEANDPGTQALLQELREASLDAVYGDYPELRKYGIERSLIEGSTRAEMRESATSIVGLIKAVATKARNETLEQHGIKAEPTGNTRKPPVDYSSMKDEDFEKLLNSIV